MTIITLDSSDSNYSFNQNLPYNSCTCFVFKKYLLQFEHSLDNINWRRPQKVQIHIHASLQHRRPIIATALCTVQMTLLNNDQTDGKGLILNIMVGYRAQCFIKHEFQDEGESQLKRKSMQWLSAEVSCDSSQRVLNIWSFFKLDSVIPVRREIAIMQTTGD